MITRALIVPTLAAFVLFTHAPTVAQDDVSTDDADASLTVDTRDIARRLIRVQQTIDVEPGPLTLHYPRWVPGNHNPSGPIGNVVDFLIRDDSGQRLRWKRDNEHIARVHTNVPEDVSSITVDFKYITNQPRLVSESSDSYGHPTFGGFNWNTVLFYPEGARKTEYMIEPELRLPQGWTHTSSLERRYARGGRVIYEPTTLAELIDSPVLMGETVSTYKLDLDGVPPHFLHAAAPFQRLTELAESERREIEEMIRQTIKVFGPFPRQEYHFQIFLSDEMPGFGLEHTESTYIGIDSEEFVDATDEHAYPITVIPHEYVHTWCGKLRAPHNLLNDNFHDPVSPELLWVYEGLTTYYTDVVSVRGGFMSEARFRDRLAGRIARYEHTEGRKWRSVVDTEMMLRILRGRSDAWQDKRRGVAYYSEGALFWMTADAIIRNGTDGRKSLDDFTRRFFDVEPGPFAAPDEYTREEVVETLSSVYDGADWDKLIRELLERPVDSLKIDLPQRLGWKMTYSREPTALQKRAVADRSGVNLRYSLGFSVDDNGVVTSVVPGSLADAAKIAYDMKVLAVNGLTFTPKRLREAVENSPEHGNVDLTVSFGDRTQRKSIRYREGRKFPRLERLEDTRDILGQIMKPR